MSHLKISDDPAEDVKLASDVADAVKASAGAAYVRLDVHVNNLLRHVLNLKDPVTGKPVGRSGGSGG